jgi:flavodoxin I
MKNVAIFYTSSTGNTKLVADAISKDLEEIKEYSIRLTGTEYMTDYSNIILGISTWAKGEMQDDWLSIWDDFCKINFTNKNVAIFGLGDQKQYPDYFVDAMGTLYNQLKDAGANVVGFTSTEGYNFISSDAVVDKQFVGLVLDFENQKDQTSSRIQSWVELIKNDFI